MPRWAHRTFETRRAGDSDGYRPAYVGAYERLGSVRVLAGERFDDHLVLVDRGAELVERPGLFEPAQTNVATQAPGGVLDDGQSSDSRDAQVELIVDVEERVDVLGGEGSACANDVQSQRVEVVVPCAGLGCLAWAPSSKKPRSIADTS